VSLATCTGQPGLDLCGNCQRKRITGIMRPIRKLTTCALRVPIFAAPPPPNPGPHLGRLPSKPKRKDF
jgi:hypothetical protein